ncbi:MAG: ATPase [Alteromonadaceae bacterium]|nr:ATPase [Alteromonadaceae bacterium]
MAQIAKKQLLKKQPLEKQSLIKYVLGIDGGGTKTLARLVNLHTKQCWQVQGGSSSLTNDLNGAIATIADLCRQVVNQAKQIDDTCDYADISAVFGLAGAGNKKRVQQLEEALAMPFAQLTICSDARTSAYGANGGKAVAVVALGTGSVGMRLNDKGDTYIVGGWGFTVGDEGSGAKLGLAAVKETIAELEDQGIIQSELAQQVSNTIGKDRLAILTWLSAAKPSDFAQFSPLIFSLALACSTAKNLLEQHLVAVEQLIQLTLAKSNLPLVLLGGLASATQPYISAKYQQQLITAKGDALDGACLFAQQ